MVDAEPLTTVVPYSGIPGGRVLPLLVSQTSPPPLPAAHVPRVRLWEAVDRGVGAGTTMIIGAAGSGKTVLAASWARACRWPGPLAWLSVDEAAVADLWAHMLHALRRALEGQNRRDHRAARRIAEQSDGHARAPGVPAGSTKSIWEVREAEVSGSPEGDGVRPDTAEPWFGVPVRNGGSERFWRDLANGITDLRTPVVIIVDDAHLITEPATLAGLELLATCSGTALRLVLCARYPVFALHRLRLDGRLAEIGPADLAFTADEASTLFDAHGVDLPPSGRNQLVERTEGWAAGLRMSLAGQRRRDHPSGQRARRDVEAAVPGSPAEPPTAEYLRAEVLAGQPSAVRRMLRRASVLDRFSGPLLETVTGEPGGTAAAFEWVVEPVGDDGTHTAAVDGRSLLTELARTNSFVIGVGGDGAWYRFHQLLADVLRADLVADEREDVSELHLRAALWFAEHRDLCAAARHASRAGDWRYAACLLLDGGLGLIAGSGDPKRDNRVGELVDAFPLTSADHAVECALVAAARCLRSGNAEAAEGYLEQARAGVATLPSSRRRPVTIALDVLQARRCELRADVDGMLNSARRLLRSGRAAKDTAAPAAAGCCPVFWWQSPSTVRAVALATRGRAELWRGRPDTASHVLRAALGPARDAAVWDVELSCRGALALLCAWRGRLRQAGSWAGDAVASSRIGAEPDVVHPAAAGLADAHLAMAVIAYQTDDLESARRCARKAADYCRRWPTPATAELLVILNAAVLACESDVRAARRLLAPRPPAGMPELCVRARVSTEGEVLLAAGSAGAALAVLRRGAGQHHPDPAEALVLARVHLARADTQAAAATLAPILRADAGFAIGHIIAASVLDALVAGRAADVARATASLARALALAEEEGVIRPFVDAGVEIATLLRTHPGLRAAHPALVDRLLDRIPGQAADAAGAGRLAKVTARAVDAHRPVASDRPERSQSPDRGDGSAPGRATQQPEATAWPVDPLAPAPSVVGGPPGMPATRAESLSSREQAVLSYLPTMLTTAEIAKELFVSVNTVKTHLKSIYRKLDVTRRRDAVHRARALHLL